MKIFLILGAIYLIGLNRSVASEPLQLFVVGPYENQKTPPGPVDHWWTICGYSYPRLTRVDLFAEVKGDCIPFLIRNPAWSEERELSNAPIVDQEKSTYIMEFEGKKLTVEYNQKSRKVILSYANQSQILFSKKKKSWWGIGEVKVAWAGDLDQDGKPDLILYVKEDAPQSYADRHFLYLSGLAGRDQLVKEAAKHEVEQVGH